MSMPTTRVPHLDQPVTLLERSVEKDKTGLGLTVSFLPLGEFWAQIKPCAYPRRPPVPGSVGLGCVAYEVVLWEDPRVLRADRLIWQQQVLQVYHSPHATAQGFVTLRALAWIKAQARGE